MAPVCGNSNLIISHFSHVSNFLGAVYCNLYGLKWKVQKKKKKKKKDSRIRVTQQYATQNILILILDNLPDTSPKTS